MATNVNTGVNTRWGKTTNTNTDNSESTTNTDFHLIELHWPTAGMGLGLTVAGAIVILVAYIWYQRRQRRMKRHIYHQRALTWEAMEWHRANCNKVETTRECNCKKTGEQPLHQARIPGRDIPPNPHLEAPGNSIPNRLSYVA